MVLAFFSTLPEGFSSLNGSKRPFRVRQASRTAIPLRSEPALAAVGDVLGTLSVEVSAICILV